MNSVKKGQERTLFTYNTQIKEQKTNEDIWKYAFRQGIIGLGISCITGWTNHSYEQALNTGIATLYFAEGSKYFFGAIDDSMATIIGRRVDEVNQRGVYSKS